MLPTKHNVIWGTPSKDASGSMPLGNGAIGINLWIETGGDICMYLSRTDSWGEFGQLYKVGRVRVRLQNTAGQSLLSGDGFRWELQLEQGAALITTTLGSVRVWVDAHSPAVHVTAESGRHFSGSIAFEIWRNERREITHQTEGNTGTGLGERHSLHVGAPYPVYHEPDEVAAFKGNRIGWFHYNKYSTWSDSLHQQGLEHTVESEQDPLLHRCFGGLIQGVDLKKTSPHELESDKPARAFEASICLHCTQTRDASNWINEIVDIAGAVPNASDLAAWDAHAAWWRAFWERSWIDADGCEAARKVSQGYTLQRYMNACSGRGEFPIKFNGSIFTVDWNYDGERFDVDYRRWGPGYWHQNTRLPYWSMLCAGDFEEMRPYFEMYRRALPIAKERIRKYCGHAGATFTETMYFWGAYLEHNYGWSKFEAPNAPVHLYRDPKLSGHLCQNQYIRRHNSSGLEVVYHGLLFYQYTSDEAFLSETLLPIAEAVIDYYDLHFERKDGKLQIAPAQVIEQWWDAVNPLPEIAGLHACLEELLDLPDALCPRRKDWERLQGELPDIPIDEEDGVKVFKPAEYWDKTPRNSENPELYSVFPYRHCHLDSDDAEVGRETFVRRTHKHDIGWAQDGMQAALLGLSNEARDSVVKRLTTPSAYARFPAFWGPGFDWIPDQDQGGSAAHALQLMVMQCKGDQIWLLPAWPDDWSVNFKLKGPKGVSVCGHKQPGSKLVYRTDARESEIFRISVPQ